MGKVLNDVYKLIANHSDASAYESQVLKLASHLLEELDWLDAKRPGGMMPPTKYPLTNDQARTLPDTFEVLSGRVSPKYWEVRTNYSD